MHSRRSARRSGARLRPAWLIGALAALLSGTGCASHRLTPFVPDGPSRPALVPAASAQFSYVDGWPHPRYPLIAEDEHYRIRALAFPSVGENGQEGNLITGRYHEGKGAGAKPLIIVLPIWGIHSFPSDAISAGLTERGAGTINVLEISGERSLIDWQAMGAATSEAEFFARLDQMVARIVDAVIDVRRLIDWARTRPEVDAWRIGLIGFSRGAIVASLAMAQEPRLAAGVVAMGGADLHAILATCGHEIAAVRRRVMANLGWSLERYEDELERALAPINPVRFAGMADPRRVLVIEAGRDTCVPRSARERLWHALGRPERVIYGYDHRTTFLAMTLLGGYDLQHQVFRFLDRTLGSGDARPLPGSRWPS